MTFEIALTAEVGGFETRAQILVRCDGVADCGLRDVLEREPRETNDPERAAVSLREAAQWLYEQGSTHPPEHWRDCDPRAGHR